MQLFITAKPRAHEDKVEVVDSTHMVVSVQEPPLQGRANAAIIRALAEHFGVPLSAVRILKGHTSRQKVIEIL